MTRLKELRKSKGLSQEEFAKIIHAAQTTVSQWEKGTRKPSYDVLSELADFFGVSIDYILGRDALPPECKPITPKTYPMLGVIACGQPTEAIPQQDTFVQSGTDFDADFCLEARGDSMINAGIDDGDIVFIKSNVPIINNHIYAVQINGEVTLKRIFQKGSILSLNAENPAYSPIILNQNEYDEIKILGKAVGVQRIIK